MMPTLFLLGSAFVIVLLLGRVLIYRSDIKRLEAVLGKSFIGVVTRGGDGILGAIISNQDVDFVFFPTYKKDNKFYYIELPVKGKGGLRREHFKISKDDVFLLRNRLLFAFILRDKIRAVNLDHIKTLEIIDDDKKTELLKDYMDYRSLMNEYKNLSARLLKVEDTSERQRLKAERDRVLKEAEAIQKKWGIIFGTLQRDKALIIEEKDDEGKVLHIFRTINFEKFSDAMTGVRPNEIYDTAVSMYNRWIMDFLKDWSKAFRVPFGQTGGSNVMYYLIIFVIILVVLVVAFRGGG